MNLKMWQNVLQHTQEAKNGMNRKKKDEGCGGRWRSLLRKMPKAQRDDSTLSFLL